MTPKQMASVSTGKVARLVCRTSVLGYEVWRVVTVLYSGAADRVGSKAKRCDILCYRYDVILCHIVLEMTLWYCAFELQISWHIVPLCCRYHDILCHCVADIMTYCAFVLQIWHCAIVLQIPWHDIVPYCVRDMTLWYCAFELQISWHIVPLCYRYHGMILCHIVLEISWHDTLIQISWLSEVCQIVLQISWYYNIVPYSVRDIKTIWHCATMCHRYRDTALWHDSQHSAAHVYKMKATERQDIGFSLFVPLQL
jgi:hypothetical protein